MIYNLKKQYQENLLLSKFSLEDNYFDNNWINSLLDNPVVMNLHILDDNNQFVQKNLWISFKIFTYQKKSKDLYKQMHKDMNLFVKSEWSMFKNPCALYSNHKISSNNQNSNTVEYLCLYISPNKSINKFDFSLIRNQTYLVQNFMELLFRSIFIDDLKVHSAFADIHSGNILFNPVVLNNFVSAYKVNIKYHSNTLHFELELKRYNLESNNITMADDICFNNKKYGKKADARKIQSGGRKFLNFENHDLLEKTKFINQLKIYSKFEDVFHKFNIKYTPYNFKPKYLINDFSSYENLNSINIWVSNENMHKFSQMFPNEKDIVDYINGKYHDKNGVLKTNGLNINKINLKYAQGVNDLIKYKNEPNLYIMFEKEKEAKGLDKDKDIQLVVEDINGNISYFDNVIDVFLNRNLNLLSESDFLIAIEKFDIYSQVKLYNLYSNKHQKHPIVSQGLIITYREFVSEKNNEDMKQEKIKSINDLTLKYKLYVDKLFHLPLSCNTVKIIERNTSNKKDIYSYILLEKEKENIFKLVEKNLLIDQEVNGINSDIDIEKSFENNDVCIILDDTYLITYQNKVFPAIILSESIYNSIQNPLVKINNHKLSNSTKSVVARNVNDLTYFPYIAKAATQLIDGNANHAKSYSGFCMLNYEEDKLYSFVKASLFSVNGSILKQTRVETLLLKKKDGLFYENSNWEDSQNLVYEILSTKTIKQLVNNSISKKSILHKLADIVINN